MAGWLPHLGSVADLLGSINALSLHLAGGEMMTLLPLDIWVEKVREGRHLRRPLTSSSHLLLPLTHPQSSYAAFVTAANGLLSTARLVSTPAGLGREPRASLPISTAAGVH